MSDTIRVRNLTEKMAFLVEQSTERGTIAPVRTGKTYVDLTPADAWRLYNDAYQCIDMVTNHPDRFDGYANNGVALIAARAEAGTTHALQSRIIDALTVVKMGEVRFALGPGDRYIQLVGWEPTGHSLSIEHSDEGRLKAHCRVDAKAARAEAQKQRVARECAVYAAVRSVREYLCGDIWY